MQRGVERTAVARGATHESAGRTGSPGFDARPELVWPGKYDERGVRARAPRVEVPLVPLEVVGGDAHLARSLGPTAWSRDADEAQQARRGGAPSGEPQSAGGAGGANLLVAGDNLLAMDALLARYEGRVDLIYIDPPFATGTDFAFDARIGDDALARGRAGLAYADAWGCTGAYLSAMADRLERMKALLADTGTIFVHCDWHVGHLLRCVLDEVFGADAFKNEIVWRYRRWPAKTRVFQRMHDVIFWYGKQPGDRHTWNPSFEPLAPSTLATWGTRRQVADFSTGRRRPSQTDEESPGAPMSDVWDIGIVAPIARERLGYPTQKPEQLVRRILEAATRPGDLVADFFCGSGTTLAVAEKLGRRWIGCDRGAAALKTTHARLLAARREETTLPPFVVAEVDAEPRHGAALRASDDGARARRVLAALGALPLEASATRGRAGRDLVLVAPDEGPARDEAIAAAAREARRLRLARLVVAGTAFGADAHARAEAVAPGLEVRLVRLPRAALDTPERGPGLELVEVPRVEAVLEPAGEERVRVRWTRVALADDAAVPAAVRAQMTKPDDLVDGFELDWAHEGHVFVHRWSAYRSRKERILPAASAPFVWTPGARVLLRVRDVFGHATDVTAAPVEALLARAPRGPGLATDRSVTNRRPRPTR